MNDRIQSVLDGETPRDSLSRLEETELAEMEEAIGAATARLRSVAVPDLADAILRQLPPERVSAHRKAGILEHAARWIWAPHAVTLRPAYGFLAAMALLLLLVGGRGAMQESAIPAEPIAQAAETTAPIYVQFRLERSGATQVSLAGTFTGWEAAHELVEVSPGTWSALIALEPGVHDYLFVVDGQQWISDPVARPVDDGFGGVNSRLFLAPPVETT